MKSPAAWRHEDTGAFGERMNSTQKYVVSSTLKNPTWANTTVITGRSVEAIKKLRAQPGKDYAVGQRHLVRSLYPPRRHREFP